MSEENIIVFAYDDIAENSENIFPGQIFNKPYGEDVYKGCKIDYKDVDITPVDFLNVLKGDSEKMKGIGNEKVIYSTKDSKIFVFFSGYGATGLLGFPQKYLYADDLISNLTYMHKQNMYSEMVLYIDACESGSMFQGLLDPTLNIYVMTATNAEESSWGTYCYPDDLKDGKHLGTCLGDLFSVNWMENSNASDNSNDSLLSQFETVKKATRWSHVMQYGQLDLQDTLYRYYLDEAQISQNSQQQSQLIKRNLIDAKTENIQQRISQTNDCSYSSDVKIGNEGMNSDNHNMEYCWSKQVQTDTIQRSSRSSRDINFHYLQSRVYMNNFQFPYQQRDFDLEENKRMRDDHVFALFKQQVNSNHKKQTNGIVKAIIINYEVVLPRNFDCLRAMIDAYEGSIQAKMGEYQMKYVRYFVQACEKTEMTEENKNQKIHELIKIIKDVCRWAI
ncbi:peptidase c13 family protein [Stylonychia lemnae]|uniref:Peptidase c13 family protein n=1 Tax=Stylonychia lemnae TaxID=5949 RepID=A0A077ZYV9_STYLE|nr:peptidase c13 family protein [Stylonychia lemnae]|eukprot:CDW73723.1 peptidase c13 family protein [Stylonychia lemnae]